MNRLLLIATFEWNMLLMILLSWYAHGESNPNRRNRNPLFYPLNYERMG